MTNDETFSENDEITCRLQATCVGRRRRVQWVL